MKRVYTLYTGDKYPPWLPVALARSLLPHGITVSCLTDQECVLRRGGLPENLFIYQVNNLPPSWWGKLYFFSEEFLGVSNDPEILVVDVDCLFLKSPFSIFDFAGRQRASMAFITEPQNVEGVGTSMFYLRRDRRSTDAIHRVWREFTRVGPSRFHGDQDFLNAVVGRAGWVQFPREFQVQYKCLQGPNSGWKGTGERVYGAVCHEGRYFLNPWKFISVHFSGRPLPDQVVRERLTCFDLFEPFIEGLDV